MNLDSIERLIEIDWKSFAKDRKSFGTVLKIWQKDIWKEQHFQKRFSKRFLIFQRFPCNLKKCLILQEIFCRHIQKCEIIFVIQYLDFQKQLVGGALKMQGKSLKIVLNEVHFKVNLYRFSLSQSSWQTLTFPRKVICSLPGRPNSKTLPSSRHINKALVSTFSLILSHSYNHVQKF